MYKITLADGSFIDNLTLNGDNFITPVGSDVDASTFEGKLDVVTITSDDPEVEAVVLNDAILVKCDELEGATWIVLREKNAQEKAEEQLRKTLATDYDNIVDLQLAIVEIYEMIINM